MWNVVRPSCVPRGSRGVTRDPRARVARDFRAVQHSDPPDRDLLHSGGRYDSGKRFINPPSLECAVNARRFATFSLIGLIASCGRQEGADTSGESPVAADSSGVQIVQLLPMPRRGGGVALESRPFLDIGGISGSNENELDLRTPWLNALRLSDGSVIVNETTVLKRFSVRGVLRDSIGRAGDGPGEFRQIREVCPMQGDSLLVVDFASSRRSVIDSSGAIVRTLATDGAIPVGACDAAGNVLVRMTSLEGRDKSSGVPNTSRFRLLSPGNEWISAELEIRNTRVAGPLMFDQSFGFAGSDIVVADPEDNSISVFARSGKLLRILRFPDPPRAVTDSDWDSLVLWAYPPRLNSPELRRLLVERARILRPPRFPSFARVWVDGDQRVWIQDFFDRTAFNVIRLTGQAVGRVVVPSGRPTHVASDYVVAKSYDADGAVHLQLYSIRTE